MATKRETPIELASNAVNWWITAYKIKVNDGIVHDLMRRIRGDIERAIQFQWTDVIKGVCPKCSGDFLEYGSRPSAAGGHFHDNSFQCNKCGDWFYQDDPRRSWFNERDAAHIPCPLCKSPDKVKHKYSGISELRTYASFEAEEKHVENEQKMKHAYLECVACGLSWLHENCPHCDSLNVHLVKDRLNYKSGKGWWFWCDFHACFNCGKSWITTGGGSD